MILFIHSSSQHTLLYGANRSECRRRRPFKSNNRAISISKAPVELILYFQYRVCHHSEKSTNLCQVCLLSSLICTIMRIGDY